MIRIDWRAIFDKLNPKSLDIIEYAAQTEVLQEAEKLETAPAIYFDTIDSFTHAAPGVSLEEKFKHMKGGVRDVGPTIIYKFQNLIIHQGHAYIGNSSRVLRRQSRSLSYRAQPTIIEEPSAMCSNRASTAAYGHLAKEQIPREMHALDLGLTPVSLAPGKHFHHDPELRALLGLARQSDEAYILRDGWIFDDRQKNSLAKKRFKLLRERILLPAAESEMNPEYVYLQRKRSKNSSTRVIENDSSIEKMLKKKGFVCADADKLTIPELRVILSNAKVVCSIEGSQCAHPLLFSPSDSSLLVLMPEDRFNQMQKEYTDMVGMTFAFVACKTVGEGKYIVNEHSLNRVLDEVM